MRRVRNIVFVVMAAVMSASVVSCRSHKSDKKRYEQTVTDDIYGGGSRNKHKNSPLRKEVNSWIGTPYQYGGHSRRGTDCSGLVMEVYRSVYGVEITHRSVDIYEKHCKRIKRNDLTEGDLVFFSFVKSGKISHVGIYIGENKFVHSSTRRGVIVSDLDEPYYRKGYVASGRVKM